MLRSLLPLTLLALLACQPDGAPAGGDAAKAAVPGKPGVPQTEEEKTLYALGLSIGESVAVFRLTPTELAMVQAGMTDQISGQPPKCELEVYGPKLSDLAESRNAAGAAVEKQKGAELIATCAGEPGAEKLASGMVFTSVTEGTGASPTPADVVKVHYKGTLRDGTEFDSSYKRNEPATFPLGGVIPCWTEGVGKMKVGGKAKLACPSELAYGDRGSPPVIPAGAALQFEVELLEILPTGEGAPPIP